MAVVASDELDDSGAMPRRARSVLMALSRLEALFPGEAFAEAPPLQNWVYDCVDPPEPLDLLEPPPLPDLGGSGLGGGGKLMSIVGIRGVGSKSSTVPGAAIGAMPASWMGPVAAGTGSVGLSWGALVLVGVVDGSAGDVVSAAKVVGSRSTLASAVPVIASGVRASRTAQIARLGGGDFVVPEAPVLTFAV